jgi:hypothetical protein
MSTLLRIALISAFLVVAALIILRPGQFRTLSQKLRLIAFLYVFAVITGAILQITGLRGY